MSTPTVISSAKKDYFPEIEFKNSYDHVGYDNGRLTFEDVPSIPIKYEAGTGPKKGNECMLNDWAIVKFKSFDVEDR